MSYHAESSLCQIRFDKHILNILFLWIFVLSVFNKWSTNACICKPRLGLNFSPANKKWFNISLILLVVVVVVVVVGGGSRNFDVKIKMHNTSIKSIFGNLIYFRDIWKMHLLSSEKYLFQRRYVATFTCFSSRPFLKQLASHVPANTLLLKFPGMTFFLIHPGNWNAFFWKVLKFVA